MSITNIDFHIDDHLIQVGQGLVRVWENGDTRKEPIEFDQSDISRILKVADEQLGDDS